MDIIETLKMYEDQGYLDKETIHGAIMESAKKYPDKDAVIDFEGTYTYRQLDDYSNYLADYFIKEGLKKDDTVLLQLPNIRLYVAVLLGLLKAGIKPVLMLPTHREKELESVGNTIHSKAYIGCVEFLGVDYVSMAYKLFKEGRLNVEKIFADTTFTGDDGYEAEVLPGFGDKVIGTEYNDYVNNYRDTALYLLSGGTTNLPKLIPRIHEAYVYNARATCKVTDITDKSVYLAVLSTSHDYPLTSPGILGCLYSGGTIVLCHTAGFDEAFDMIERYKVTFTSIVPAIALIWAEVLDWYEADFSSLERISLGAAKIDRKLALKLIDKLDIKLHQAYGLGEGITCYTSIDDPLDVILETQGKPVSKGDSVKIVDANGNELSPYEQGELLEKGPYTFMGYYGNEALNENLFTEDGYLHTGDKAYLDADGNVVICGRVKEQINRAGENVSPVEVETILRKHPDIKDAAVFGRSDERLGERTTAMIISDNPELTNTDIVQFFIKEGIAQYKIPDEIHFTEKFLYTNVGKVDKKNLRRFLEESEQDEQRRNKRETD